MLYDEPDYVSTKVSAQAKDLLQKLLEKDPLKRMTLAEMRVHPWLTGGALLKNSIIRRASSAISDQLMARRAEIEATQREEEVRQNSGEQSTSSESKEDGDTTPKAKPTTITTTTTTTEKVEGAGELKLEPIDAKRKIPRNRSSVCELSV